MRIKTYQYVKIVIILGLFFAFLVPIPYPLAPAAASAAGQSFSVSPVIITVPLSPGKTYTHQITIDNLTDQPLPFRIHTTDFESSGEEGGYTFYDIKTNPLLTWLTLSDSNLILSPREKKKLTLTINTPESIPLGGYYGMLSFEPVSSDEQTDATRIVSRVGVLLLANVGVPDENAKKAEILTFSTGIIHENGQIPLLLRVKNTSLHYFTAKPIVTIAPLINFSSENKPLYLEEKIIFQGKVRRWQTQLSENLSPNIYKVQMAVSTGNGNTVRNNNYIIVFPWKPTLILTGVALFLTLLAIKRKRLKKAFDTLLHS